jgi:Domain of unknown function (DUF1707)
MAMNDGIRASDADRERITTRLRDHFAEGRLTRDELDERVTAALHAKTLGDLRGLMTDLPEPRPLLPEGGLPSRAAPAPAAFVRRGPRLLPLVLLLAFAGLALPGAGLVFLAAFQFFLLFVLVSGVAALLTGARFRRRARRQWIQGSHPSWGHPL